MFDRQRKAVSGLCLLGLTLCFGLSVRADEGYDPMLQISNQFAKPNVLIELDVTGSMAFEQGSAGATVGIDSFGLPAISWSATYSPALPSPPTPTKSDDTCGNKQYWYTCTYAAQTYTVTYTLTATGKAPCRMDVFKNALGNSVPLYGAYSGSTYISPSFTWPATWPKTYSGFTYIGNGQWTRTVTVPASSTVECRRTAPTCSYTPPNTTSPPFAISTPPWSSPDYSSSPGVTPKFKETGFDPGFTPSKLPQNIVGINQGVVNWGLETFSTDGITERVRVKADDTISVQAAQATLVQSYLKPATLPNGTAGGLDVGGSTNTPAALNQAKASLKNTYSTGGPGGGADPKTASCGRIYAVVLVTDGQSNTCYISTATNANCATKQGSGWSCDTTTGVDAWASYPAGRSSELFFETSDSTTACTGCRPGGPLSVPTRTFVIGVSQEVARCELNLTAFFGRTDASAPNGDAGMAIEKDYTLSGATKNYRLGPAVPSNFKSYFTAYQNLTALPTPLSTTATEGADNYRAVDDTTCGGTSQPACKDYAYFANDPTALYEAFVSIIGALAAGDYTTAAPVASSTSTTGTVAILPSTEYPKWKGHLYAFDLTKNAATDWANYFKWDAGYNLAFSTGSAANPAGTGTNLAYVSPANRKIYSWNPSTKALIPVTSSALNTDALNTACGCGLTDNDVQFMLGYDGSGGTATTNYRPWILSSTINSTPAIVQSPEKFQQGYVEAHDTFEVAHKSRAPLVWMGADDGMLHAFKLADGSEALALIPPNLLALQKTFRAKYNATKAPTGQPGLPGDHIYGLASSPRYGDVYFSADTEYKTLMLVTEGPGGNLIAGVDVTDPVGNLAASSDPVTIKWSKTGSDWSGLYQTWSTPAMGASAKPVGSTHSVWTGISGAGFNAASTVTSPVVPKALMFDATTGTLNGTQPTLANHTTPPAALVGNQTFADSVIYQMNAVAFYPDNIVNLALQADLNGQIWFVPGASFGTGSVGIDATTKAGQQQPIYYPPAVNAYTDTSNNSVDLYAFGSGTVYEKSANVTGSCIGCPTPTTDGTPCPSACSGTYYTPSIYLVVKPQDTAAAATSQILRIPINEIYVPDDLNNYSTDPANPTPCSLASNQELVGTYNQVLCKLNTPHVRMGHRTQISAPPALFVPIAGVSGDPVAVFLLYDPDQGCAGEAYIVQFNFNTNLGTGSGTAPSLKKTIAYDAGVGAASGFAVAGSSVIVAKSAVGQGAQAGVSKVPGLNPTSGMSNPVPIWWRELK